MKLDYNPADNPPSTVRELWDRINRLFKTLPSYVVKERVKITAGAAGTIINHGQFPRKPRFVTVVLDSSSGSTNLPAVDSASITNETVRIVVGGADVVVNLRFDF